MSTLTLTLPPRPRAIFLGGDGVHYQERAPGAALMPWVQAFWHLRCERPYPLRVLPDGCMDIIGSDVVGSLSTALVANLEAGDEVFGVRLRPGAFTALYGVPASELSDLRLPLADVVRPRPLHELARDAPPPDPVAAAALHAADVRTLARETGYSPATCAGAWWPRPDTAPSAWRASVACRRCSRPGAARAGRAPHTSSAFTTSRT